MDIIPSIAEWDTSYISLISANLENEWSNGQVPDDDNLIEGRTDSPRFPSRICENKGKMCAAEEIQHAAAFKVFSE